MTEPMKGETFTERCRRMLNEEPDRAEFTISRGGLELLVTESERRAKQNADAVAAHLARAQIDLCRLCAGTGERHEHRFPESVKAYADRLLAADTERWHRLSPHQHEDSAYRWNEGRFEMPGFKYLLAQAVALLRGDHLAPVGEHAQRENSRSEVEARRAADAVPAEEQADAQPLAPSPSGGTSNA